MKVLIKSIMICASQVSKNLKDNCLMSSVRSRTKLTVFIANCISRQVIIRYTKKPTTSQYQVGLSKSVSSAENLTLYELEKWHLCQENNIEGLNLSFQIACKVIPKKSNTIQVISSNDHIIHIQM